MLHTAMLHTDLMRRSSSVVLALLCIGSSSAQTVHVVPESPGVVGILQPFLDAAAPGDTLLLPPGTFRLGIVDKPLKVLCDANTTLIGSAIVSDVDIGEVVIQGFGGFLAERLTIVGCAARVWIEDLGRNPSAPGIPQVLVSDSSAVTFSNCHLIGSRVFLLGGFAPALAIENSSVAIYDSLVTGATGIAPLLVGDGGVGLSIRDSFVAAQRSEFRGGSGTPSFGVVPARDGGNAIEVTGLSTFRARQTDLVAGLGGPDFVGGGVAGSDGQTIVATPSAVVVLSAEPTHALKIPALVREGEAVNYRITGPAGDIPVLTFTFAPQFGFAPLFDGVLLTGPPFATVQLDPIPVGGSLSVPTSPMQLLPGIDSATFYVQLFGFDPVASQISVGNGTSITLLDGMF